jgi:signal transduction histidine kinase
MKIATVPANEQDRLIAINEYNIPGILPDADFDDFTQLASDICQTPIALISIVDAKRVWFMSEKGLSLSEIPRDWAFCAHAINSPAKPMIVEDLSADARFRDNPLVADKPKARFYAGIPLVTPTGLAIGTLSVWDRKPRKLDASQLKNLQLLARQIIKQLELRKTISRLSLDGGELKMALTDLEQISYIASHDLKSPLNNIISLTHLIKDNYSTKLDHEGNEYINYLNDAAYQLSDLIAGLLQFSLSSHLSVEHKEPVNVASLIEEITASLKIPENYSLSFDGCKVDVYTTRVALKQIFLNLLQSAINQGEDEQVAIVINFSENNDQYVFEVRDNGPGIPPEDQEHLFELYYTRHQKNTGNDKIVVGLAAVKRLLEKLGGEIKIESELSQGSGFIFSIPK